MKKLILLFCTMVTLCGCSVSEHPTDAYKAYIENIQKGDVNATMDSLDKDTKDLLMKEGGFTAMNDIKKFIDSHKGIKSIKFEDTKIKDGFATAKVSLFFNDGFSKAGTETKYVKENGKWKLSFSK